MTGKSALDVNLASLEQLPAMILNLSVGSRRATGKKPVPAYRCCYHPVDKKYERQRTT